MEIDAITLKLLEKDPAQRYPSADDLRADLRRFREGAKLAAGPGRGARRGAPVAAAPPAPADRLRLLRGRPLRRAAPPRPASSSCSRCWCSRSSASGSTTSSQQLDEKNDTARDRGPDVVGQNRHRAATRPAGRPASGSRSRRRPAETSPRTWSSARTRRRATKRLERRGGDHRGQRRGREPWPCPNVVGQDFLTATQTLEDGGVRRVPGTGRGPDRAVHRGPGLAAEPGGGHRGPAGLGRHHPHRPGRDDDHRAGHARRRSPRRRHLPPATAGDHAAAP